MVRKSICGMLTLAGIYGHSLSVRIRSIALRFHPMVRPWRVRMVRKSICGMLTLAGIYGHSLSVRIRSIALRFHPMVRPWRVRMVKKIHLWDADTGRHIRTLTERTDSVYSVAFSPDGQTLASGGNDGTVRLWDTNTGRSLHTLTGHTDLVEGFAFSRGALTPVSRRVSSVAFSPDGQTLASGGDDGTIRLWDANTGRSLHTLTGHMFRVYGVVFFTRWSEPWRVGVMLGPSGSGMPTQDITCEHSLDIRIRSIALRFHPMVRPWQVGVVMRRYCYGNSCLPLLLMQSSVFYLRVCSRQTSVSNSRFP